MPPQQPLPPAKKVSPLIWILVAVVGLVFLCVTAVAVGGYLFVSKVKQVASSPGGVARMVARMNPDVEVISTDDSSGKITLKDKKTGKVVTLNFDDVKNGRIAVHEDGKGDVVINAKAADGTVELTSPEGKVNIGAGSAKMPAWVPVYPGSSPQGNFTSSGDKEDAGHFMFTTKDSQDQVTKYYQDELKKSGYSTTTTGVGVNLVAAHTADGKRTVVVTIAPSGEGTAANIAYSEKK